MTNGMVTFDRFILAIGLLGLLQCKPDTGPVPEQPVPAVNSLFALRNDMALPHEGAPNGVPQSFDWAQGPRTGWGNNPPSDWFAMIPWGQVYRDTRPIVATNTRVHIRNMQAWYLSKRENIWKKWTQTSNIQGAYYLEDFANDTNIPADIKTEAEGGISIKVIENYNFHFWCADGRITIDPTDINGVWVAIEARLIVDNESLPDDRDQANFMMSAGADYWKTLTAPWDNFTTNGDIGIGRFRFVTKHWQAFNMHTLTAQQLQQQPPF
jgi:hypothetical protein